MRPKRNWQAKIKILLNGCALAALIALGGRTLAQMRQAERDERRDERRIERKVDDLQKDHDELKLSLERRLVRLETLLTSLPDLKWLLGLIGVLQGGQLAVPLGRAARALLEQRRGIGNGGD